MTIQRSLFTGTGTRGLNSTRVMPLWRPATPEGENHEDASCCCHSCDGDRSPRSGEGEAVAIGAPARLSVVGATRLLPRLPSEGLVPRRVIELLIFGDSPTIPPRAGALYKTLCAALYKFLSRTRVQTCKTLEISGAS